MPVNGFESEKQKLSAARRVFSWGVDLFLIAMIGLGCVFALQASWRKSELDFHLNQLADKSGANLSGSFVVQDPDRVYVKAIETNNPLEFKWHVYLPIGFKRNPVVESVGSRSGKVVSTVLTQPSYSIARFKIKRAGDYAVCEHQWLGEVSVLPSDLPDSKETLEFLEQSNFDGAVLQTGKAGVQSFSKDEDVELLKLMVPAPNVTSNRNAPKPGFGQFVFSLRDRIR